MSKNIHYILATLVILSVTLFPEIKIGPGYPSFQLIDLLLPLLGLSIVFSIKKFNYKRLYTYLLIFAAYIGFTILWNKTSNISNYFEVYKVIKFIVIISYFSIIQIDLKKILVPIFISLVLFNLLHYFSLFGINTIIKNYYSGDIHIDLFGLNSLGLPGTKRMIGTMQNPNNNALLFTFFSILFLPIKNKSSRSLILFGLSLTMMLLCQSRTAMAAFVIMFVLFIIVNKENLKNILVLLATLVSAYILFIIISITSDLRPVFEGGLRDYSSMRGRFESWKYLFEMIKNKPFLGHSPHKSYFYTNDLHAENEYILYAWRYGLVGLLAYLAFLAYLIKTGIKSIQLPMSIQIIMLTVIIALTAITNAPISDRSILVFFALILGVYFKKITKHETN